MKSLLRTAIFFVSLLFLPDPLFAVFFTALSKAPTSEQLHMQHVVLSDNFAAIDIAGSNGWVLRKEDLRNEQFGNRNFLLAQATDGTLERKKLDAQRSQNGLRVKKKKDFFKSKTPLPAIKMPTDWDGQVSSPQVQNKKSKAKTESRKLTKGTARLPVPAKKPELRRVKKTKSGAIYESQTYRKTPLSQQSEDKTSGIRAFGQAKVKAQPGYTPRSPLFPATAKLPLPRLKPKGFDQKKQAQRLEIEKRKKTAETRNQTNDKQGDNTARKVQRTAFVVPPPVTVWKPKEIQEAQLVCQVLMKGIDATVTPIKPIRRGACGTPAPLKLKAVGEHKSANKIKINPAATLNCQYTARFAKWANEKLQPLALKHLNSPVAMVHNVASYSCRHRYNDKTRKLSEHALANALDIAGFTLKNGTTVSVLKHWDEEGDLGAFLKAVHASACESFVVVLGPEANEAHKNHFHFDVGRYKVCE